jgi:hypothetical protein
MSAKKPWRFSESRPIKPFRTSEDALNATQFRIRGDHEFSAEAPWLMELDPDEVHKGNFKPEFKIKVDFVELSSVSGLKSSDLVLTLVLHDPALLSNTALETWNVDEIPEECRISQDVLKQVSGQRGLRLSLQLTPSQNLAENFRTASKQGQIVCERHFDIKVPDDGSGFPIELVEANYFEGLGLSKETVWIVKWNTTFDFDRPAEDVLCVLINKEQGEKLLRISGQDSLGSVIWREIAIEVFLEICLVIYNSEPEPPTNTDSLLHKITQKLQAVSGQDLDVLVLKSRDKADGMRFFRSHLQASLELASQIRRINLAGRIQ